MGTPIPEHSELARRAWVDSFVDELGQRPEITTPFLTWCARLRGIDAPAPSSADQAAPDSMLWWSLTDSRIDPTRYVNLDADGPIIRQGERLSIEVWTERELCGLHAFWRLTGALRRPDWQNRCFRCVDWLLETLQPDNATNYPWAIHVFVLAAHAGRTSADLYAQMLLHNCQVSLGHPDRLSAFILRDAADALADPAI